MIDVAAILKDANWDKQKPARPESIQMLVDNAGKELPEDYLALLRYSDGGEGTLGIQPGWLQLWSSADVLEHNKGYAIAECLPGFIGFGSNGGGELLAFDTQSGKPWKIVMIPFISTSADEARVIANDFAEFIRAIGRHFRS